MDILEGKLGDHGLVEYIPFLRSEKELGPRIRDEDTLFSRHASPPDLGYHERGGRQECCSAVDVYD